VYSNATPIQSESICLGYEDLATLEVGGEFVVKYFNTRGGSTSASERREVVEC
jgi:hypothetical protein